LPRRHSRSDPAADPDGGLAVEVADTVLLHGSIFVRWGEPNERVDLLLDRGEDGDSFIRLAAPGRFAPADTIDGTGLYVHSANPYVPSAPTVRFPGYRMHVVRTGPSPGDPAEWIVHWHEWRRVHPDDNHPPGPVDARVGCYHVEREEWSDPEAVTGQPNLWFPDDIRLHWQYHWPYGPPKYLVATDLAGEIGGPTITWYSWMAPSGDSLQVGFGGPFVGTSFRGVRADNGYVGEASAAIHHQGVVARARTRLVKVACPDEAAEKR
jgi:hypothetical protein